jgi:xanthine dehydrogenase accessory factor
MPGINVRVTATQGSAPREAGATMWVTELATSGTIGGGALERSVIEAAREMLRVGEYQREIDQPLGPEIGQCCGGRVQLLLQRQTTPPPEALTRPPVLIFGAGHVGTALARALALLPVKSTIIDERSDWLTPLSAIGHTVLTPLPETEVRAAPQGAAFVVLTHDHALDFLIVEAVLQRGDAAYVGMIGSATKRGRLVANLSRKGIDTDALVCPIGAGGSRDKRPEVIAASVAAEIAAALL